MNRKLIALLGVVTLGIGGATTIALQTHAQTATPTPVVSSTTTTVAPQDVKTASDTDNIQDDKGTIDQPDATVQSSTDKETNDDAKTTASSQKDIPEAGDTADAPDAGSAN